MADDWDQFKPAAQTGSWDQFKPVEASKPKTATETVMDILKSIRGGLVKGPMDIAGAPADIIHAAMSGLGIPTRDTSQPLLDTVTLPGGLPSATTGEIMATNAPKGGYYEPQTGPGKFAERAAEFAPAALGGEASLGARALGRVLAPAAGSFAGELVDKKDHPYVSAALGTGGAVLAGGLAGGARAAASGRLADALLGHEGANPNAISLADKAATLGIDIRPGQLSPNRFINTADDQISRLPFTGYGESGAKISTEAQSGQFTKALGKTIGVDAPALTPDVIAGANKNIGNIFTEALAGTKITGGEALTSSLAKVENAIADVAPALDPKDVMRMTGTLNKVLSTVADGMTGEQYQSMRQVGGLLDGLSKDANPTIANIGNRMRETLDDAFQAEAPAEKAALISKARSLYRNMLVIEPLADKAPLGHINPPLLLGQVNKVYSDLSKAGDIGDLGRIGQAFLKTPPNSGTAERSLVLSLMRNPLKAAGEVAAVPFQASIGRGMGTAINSKAALARLLSDRGATAMDSNPKLISQLLMMK